MLALCVTDFDLLELVELDNGAGEVHDILATLLEGVKADEESVGGDFPLVCALCLALVLEVSILEFGASLECKCELIMSFLWLLVLN